MSGDVAFSSAHADEGQSIYTGDRLLQIAMPLGGIGAGCICLNGYGGLQDFSIRHHPALSASPDRHLHGDAAFALLRDKASGNTRLVEGPFPPEKIYDQGLRAQGYRGGGYEGFPRFRECSFIGEYPFGTVHLTEPGFPLQVTITGFNPFIPLDVKHSSIPCVILEYRLLNATTKPVNYEFSFHLSHLAPGKDPKLAPTSRNAIIPGKGIFLFNDEDPVSEEFGSACLMPVGSAPLVKAMWFRGSWSDALTVLWREISTGKFQPNEGTNPSNLTGRNGGSILLKGCLAPGESILYPLVIAWHFPNVGFRSGGIKPLQTDGSEECGWACKPGAPEWRPYYVTHWKDARNVAEYVRDNYSELRSRTQAFHDALFSSSIPAPVLEAVSANLAIIKSPTILLQENGNLWGWEGCFSDRGCCPGSCTHVWNYAQSIPHLFPELERTLREQELERSMDGRGHVNFRSALPDGPPDHAFHAAADGQPGGIMKVYREWQISGNQEWLVKLYLLVKRSMDYCIETWDPQRTGVLIEPHHNTYDIEFWGPDSMCSSIYIGALVAMAAMARATGHPEHAPEYEFLARRGALFIDENLFNGEYYQQQVKFTGLRDASFAEASANINAGSPSEQLLLKNEGPKYQYGSGCLSDGVLGVWLAEMCGLELPLSSDHIRKNLHSIFKYNYKRSLWEHTNPQRPGYALGEEPGLLLCTWPRGGKPTLPFVYSDEVWTGIEYQVASHLILNGYVDEGLQIVQAARSRYDGRVRNPWNEYECGSYYARAMASYALLLAISGVAYSAVSKTLFVAPKIDLPKFRTFFSINSGWGTILLDADQLEIKLVEGFMQLDKLQVTWRSQTYHLQPDLLIRAGASTVIKLSQGMERR
jgi:uncharacterized protein (DUF608 family)